MRGLSRPEPLPLRMPATRCEGSKRSGDAVRCNHSTSWIPRTTWKTGRLCLNMFRAAGRSAFLTIGGGIKKTVFFLSEKLRKWGGRGLAESEISLSEKTEIFLEFFLKGGGVPPIPKGCYHKKWGYWDIFAKKGALTQSIGMLSKKKLRIFRNFSPKGGGVSPIPKFPYQKKLGLPNC